MKRQNITLATTAIIAIAILEAIALIQGVNGAVFGIVVAVIAGLAGYKIKPPSQ